MNREPRTVGLAGLRPGRAVKRVVWTALSLCLFRLAFAPGAPAVKLPRIGLLVYNAEDTFMQTVCARIQDVAQGFAEVTLLDGGNSQIVQNDQENELLGEGVDALIINAVDRTTAVYMIRAAMRCQVRSHLLVRSPDGA